MPSYGCIPPKDLANRVRLSFFRHGPRLLRLPVATQPSYDARAIGLVPPVKDQGQCGSCWDFAGTGIAEMAAIGAGISNATNTNWSEQSVLDCGRNGGCSGDWPETALEQAKNSGLANTQDYPYRGGAGQCRAVPHPNVILDYGYVGSSEGVPATQSIKDALLAHGPLAVAVAADDAWSNYSGGVFRDSGARGINHAVILVGWQDDSSRPGGGFWVVRNSWSEQWGEGGYIRTNYGANLIGYGAMWATCQKLTPGPTPPPVPPPPPGPVTLDVTVTGKTQPYTFRTGGLFGSTVTIPGQSVTSTGKVTISRM